MQIERLDVVNVYGLPRDDGLIARRHAKLVPELTERAKRLPANILRGTARLRAE
jgi:hypothetical protein